MYMVAAWGGFTFVLNMVGLHAFLLCLQTPLCGVCRTLCGGAFGQFPKGPSEHYAWRDPSSLNLAFSLFYVLGTAGAMQVPVVGSSPLKSLEQLMPMGVFVLLQLLQLNAAYMKGAARSKEGYPRAAHASFLIRVAAVAGAAGAVALGVMIETGYLGPLSSRVRGLFVRHTRTGNPLVDSVAEHQSTRPEMYYAYFHFICYTAPVGFLMLLLRGGFGGDKKRTPAVWFAVCYTFVAYYFSAKMVRLVLILAAPASVCGAVGLKEMIAWALRQYSSAADYDLALPNDAKAAKAAKESAASTSSSTTKAAKKAAQQQRDPPPTKNTTTSASSGDRNEEYRHHHHFYDCWRRREERRQQRGRYRQQAHLGERFAGAGGGGDAAAQRAPGREQRRRRRR